MLLKTARMVSTRAVVTGENGNSALKRGVGWGLVATGRRARGRGSSQDERDWARWVVADAAPTLLWYPDDLGSWQAANPGRLSLIPAPRLPKTAPLSPPRHSLS